MPIPATMETNITEKMLRWPTTRVTMPIDQRRLTLSTTVKSTGLITRRNATTSSPTLNA